MTDLARNFMLLLMSEKCYDNYFVEFDFFNAECFKALLSKGLGIGIIAGSVLVKVPQIVKILTARSAEGINIFSVMLDLFAITLHMSYSFVSGFPFSAWGDASFLAIQTAIIAALVLFYGGGAVKSGMFCVVYVGLCYTLMALTPLSVLWSGQGFNVPILLVGKLSQALTNYRNKSTGQLSAATCFMLFAGSLARIFTSVQETGDFMMIFTYSASTFANGVIVAQLLWYWNSDKGKKSAAKVGDGKQQQKTKQRSKKVD